jgi:peroxiredoxin
VLAALLGALVAALALAACTGGSDAPEQQGSFRYVSATDKGSVIPEGDRKKAGDITGTLLDGSTFSLDKHVGDVMLINFWGSWCGPCVAETPALDKIYRADESQGVLFLGIAVKDDEDATKAFVSDNDISYPILYDFNAKSALQLGDIPMRALPATVVIDKQGRVAGVFLGPLLDGDVNPVISKLLAEN